MKKMGMDGEYGSSGEIPGGHSSSTDSYLVPVHVTVLAGIRSVVGTAGTAAAAAVAGRVDQSTFQVRHLYVCTYY